MNRVFSENWFFDYFNEINRNADYENNAKDWEGDILFIVRGDPLSENLKAGIQMLVRLDLYHGKCREINFYDSEENIKTQYSLDGTASDWEAVLKGSLDIVTSILQGKIRVSGNKMKLMRYIPAAEQLILSARKVSMF